MSISQLGLGNLKVVLTVISSAPYVIPAEAGIQTKIFITGSRPGDLVFSR